MSTKTKNDSLSFSFKIEAEEIQNELNTKIRDRMSKAINEQIKACFSDGGYWGKNPGYGYDAINLAIESYLGSAEFETKIQETIQKYINEAMDSAIEEATTRAARKMAYMITENKAKSMASKG